MLNKQKINKKNKTKNSQKKLKCLYYNKIIKKIIFIQN